MSALPTREEIAEILKAAPTKCHVAEYGMCGGWDLCTNGSHEPDFGAMADALLARLRPAWERVTICEDHGELKHHCTYCLDAHTSNINHISNGYFEAMVRNGEERDALRADLRACAEAMRPFAEDTKVRNTRRDWPPDDPLVPGGVTNADVWRLHDALARPGVQAERKK